MELDWVPEVDDLSDSQRAQLSRVPWYRYAAAMSVAPVILLVVLLFDHSRTMIVIAVAVLVVCVWSGVRGYRDPGARAKKMFERVPVIRSPKHVDISLEHGIQFTDASGSTNYPWARVLHVTETERSFVLGVQITRASGNPFVKVIMTLMGPAGMSVALPLPKRGTTDVEQLRAILASQVPSAPVSVA